MPFVNDLIEHNRDQLTTTAANAGAPKGVSRFRFDPVEVMQLLRSRIVEQPHVLDAVESILQVVKADFGDPERPLAVTLFMGPTGVGKTEVVRLIAEALHGSTDALCRIDMNTLAQEHYAAALTGAPPGYVGSKEGTTLLDAEKIQGSFSRPGVVLFDELEKASREVTRSLLGVLERGQLTLSAGSRTIDFRNSLVFLTSNVGAEAGARYRQTFAHGWRGWLRLQPRREEAVLQAALHRQFDPEFLNRIDRILTFRHIDAGALQRLLDIELDKLGLRLRRKGRQLQLTPAARTLICSRYDDRFGARDIARHVRTLLEPAIAAALLADPAAADLSADAVAGGIVVTAAAR